MILDEARESRRKLCEGMDALTLEEKERCLLFAKAISAIEGLTINKHRIGTAAWKMEERWDSFLSGFWGFFEKIWISNMRSKNDMR